MGKLYILIFYADVPKISLNGLRDAVENRLTFQYSDGTYYRVTLPPLASSSLVESCINAVRQTLPRDSAILVLSRWYATRNAPGPMDFSLEKEWNMFSNVLLGKYQRKNLIF